MRLAYLNNYIRIRRSFYVGWFFNRTYQYKFIKRKFIHRNRTIHFYRNYYLADSEIIIFSRDPIEFLWFMSKLTSSTQIKSFFQFWLVTISRFNLHVIKIRFPTLIFFIFERIFFKPHFCRNEKGKDVFHFWHQLWTGFHGLAIGTFPGTELLADYLDAIITGFKWLRQVTKYMNLERESTNDSCENWGR